MPNYCKKSVMENVKEEPKGWKDPDVFTLVQLSSFVNLKKEITWKKQYIYIYILLVCTINWLFCVITTNADYSKEQTESKQYFVTALQNCFLALIDVSQLLLGTSLPFI